MRGNRERKRENMKKMDVSRRQFIKSSTVLAAGAMVAPYVITSHAAPVADLKLRVGLVGCGGRGQGGPDRSL